MYYFSSVSSINCCKLSGLALFCDNVLTGEIKIPHSREFLKIVKNIRVPRPGPGCSKLTTSLVNVSLSLLTLIHVSEICQCFMLKKCEELLQSKSFSHFLNKR